MPVMVCVDGFILTHAYERVDMPTQEQVDAYLPPFEPRQVLDPKEPVSIGAMVGPEAFMEVRYLAHHKQMRALELIPQLARGVQAGLRPRLGRPHPHLPRRGCQDHRRRHRLGERHHQGRHRRAARGGLRHRRRRRSSPSAPSRATNCTSCCRTPSAWW
jgi:hypothetical protein